MLSTRIVTWLRDHRPHLLVAIRQASDSRQRYWGSSMSDLAREITER